MSGVVSSTADSGLPILRGNRGEWSEVYIFLKLLVDGKVFAADKNMRKIAERYLKILKIFREEIVGGKLEYFPGASVKIVHDGKNVCAPLPVSDVSRCKDKIWSLMMNGPSGIIQDSDVQEFLHRMFVFKLKSPSEGNDYFGGTQDIVMEVEDYKTGIASVVGFSCKSDFSSAATLFNASKDNTNFRFKVTGAMTDDIANQFNSMFDVRGDKKVIATARRMRFLKEKNCQLSFYGMVTPSAKRNLTMVCGSEAPVMIAEMLRHYYYDGEGGLAYSPISGLVKWVSDNDIAGFEYENVGDVYWYKVSHLLYSMFTGMRLGKPWSGRSSVNGGYIIVRGDGEVLAYHTCIADEFMDFLVQRLALEQPSHARHLSMKIEKSEGGEYFVKLPLQIRFRVIK